MHKIIFLLFILYVFYYQNSFANAYIKNKNEFLIILESSTTSNKRNIISKINNSDFKSTENKMYIEYGLGNKFAINGYIKSLDLKIDFETKLKNETNNNYFYNIGVQYNIAEYNNNYITFNFSFYDYIKFDKILFITSNNDIFKSIEYGISYGYFFNNFYGKYNNNFINLDIKHRLLQNSYKDNFNTNLTIGRKINSTSLLMIEYLYNKDIIKNTNFHIDKYYYNGSKILSNNSRRYKIKNHLSSTYHTIKLSSITNFTDNLAFKIGIEKSFYKNDKKSYSLNTAFWLNF